MEKDKVSIKKVYKSVFGETLFQKGFVIDKKYGWFMKVVGEDVLQYFRLRNDQADSRAKKAFFVEMGMVSMYIKAIDKDTLVYNAKRAYTLMAPKERATSYRFEYDSGNIFDATVRMKEALGEAENVFFPCTDAVTDLNSYLEYCKAYKNYALSYATRFVDDSLILIVSGNHDDFEDVFERELNVRKESYFENGIIDENSEEYKRLRYCVIDLIAGERDKVYADKKLFSAALEEAKRRKEANLEILREMEVIS
jgi:hypothetical protein